MPDLKISELAAVTGVLTTDEFVLARSGATNKISGDDLAAAIGSSVDGWIADQNSWTYASADDPTFTMTASGDLTGIYSAGMRIRLTQTTVKYFIITAVSHSSGTTTMTLYGGTDYDLANAAISSPYYSPAKAPQGFPLDPLKWTVEVTDTSIRTQASPTNNTWYNLGSNTISVPIGSWRVFYEAVIDANSTNSTGGQVAYLTLSTANNSESDKAFTALFFVGDANAANKRVIGQAKREKTLLLAAKTSYYLNEMSNTSATSLDLRGDLATTVIRAICAYL